MYKAKFTEVNMPGIEATYYTTGQTLPLIGERPLHVYYQYNTGRSEGWDTARFSIQELSEFIGSYIDPDEYFESHYLPTYFGFIRRGDKVYSGSFVSFEGLMAVICDSTLFKSPNLYLCMKRIWMSFWERYCA